MKRSKDVYSTGSQLKKIRSSSYLIIHVNILPNRNLRWRDSSQKLGVLSYLCSWLTSDHQGSICLHCLLAAVPCRGWASLAFRLCLVSELWSGTTEILSWLEPENNSQEKSLSCAVQWWGKNMLRTGWNACLAPCASERAMDVIKGHSWGCQHKKQMVLLANPTPGAECWNSTTSSPQSCQHQARMRYRKSTDLASSMALLSIAVQKPSVSPDLRLGLFSKNQKREGRKDVWFLVSS